jgi:hypothetical protein
MNDNHRNPCTVIDINNQTSSSSLASIDNEHEKIETITREYDHNEQQQRNNNGFLQLTKDHDWTYATINAAKNYFPYYKLQTSGT